MVNKASVQKINYQNIRRCGRRLYAQKWLIVLAAPNQLQSSRYGWTLPRYVGSAVLRNKYKRWLRELLRADKPLRGQPLRDKLLCGQLGRGPLDKPATSALDINFVFKRMHKGFYKNKSFLEFKHEIQKALKKVALKNTAKQHG